MMDALDSFRAVVCAGKLPVPCITSDASSEPQAADLVSARYLYFALPTPHTLPLETITRFVQGEFGRDHPKPDEPVNLRTLYLAYTYRDESPALYLAKVVEDNTSLPPGQHAIQMMFVEKLELITYLEGGDAGNFIKPLEVQPDVGAATTAAVPNTVPVISGTGAAVTQTSVNGRPVKVIDARLQAIYDGERKMGDRNTVLRGIKPTDFSHVRKHRDTFLPKKDKSRDPRATASSMPSRPGTNPTLGKPTSGSAVGASKRVDPIILLSPSASSLLRMSNIKTFLDEGLYVPFDHAQLANFGAANLLHLTRKMNNLGGEKPYRFILVDSPEQFKPEYWDRVVAVFTTGQTWQFRGYKWREPQALFEHVLGIYLGERGQAVPAEVKGWGNNVKTFMVERWDEKGHGAGVDHEMRVRRRWKDREVVEEMWRAIEMSMKGKGIWQR